MSPRSIVVRLLAGLALLAALLTALFAITLPAIHRWGATDAELARALPGDEQLSHPQVAWTNAITIAAPPEQVWPWLAQLGDSRGGFYSFTFIENRVGAITGDPSYAVVYRNANAVVPAWQRPQPGDPLIQGVLNVAAVEPGEWLLGGTAADAPFGWSWLWQLEPSDGGATRLLVRMRIQTDEAIANPVVGFVMDIGGFVMQQRMLHGIALRAEGGVEPAWAEPAEIGLWLAALLAGLAAGLAFLLRPAWGRPLTVAVAAVLAIFLLTFAQPALWLRALIDLALLGAAWWVWLPARPRLPAPGMVKPSQKPSL